MHSQILNMSPQADGRSYIRERHTDHLGIHHDVEYLAEAGADIQTAMLDRAAQITANLEQSELDYWLSFVRDGQPIPADGCRYVERGAAMAYVFRTLALDPDPQALWRAAWMVPYFADEELAAVGFDTEQVAAIRDRAAKLDMARQLLESVTPLEGA